MCLMRTDIPVNLTVFLNEQDFKMTLVVSTPPAHPAVFEAWTGLSQLCSEPGGSP